MEQKVLIAYASKYGATAEIAQKMGAILRESGLPVDVLAANGIRDLTPYQAVILGSAIYIGKWPKEAEAFLKTHEQALAERPVWLFSSGPTGAGDPVQLVEGQRLPPGLQPVVSRIRPRDIALFHGFINPERINFIEKWAVQKAVKKPMGDFRDWKAIETWARQVAETIHAIVPA
jgi:menaquinone-dependent protoporphyrinogen oxidase